MAERAEVELVQVDRETWVIPQRVSAVRTRRTAAVAPSSLLLVEGKWIEVSVTPTEAIKRLTGKSDA